MEWIRVGVGSQLKYASIHFYYPFLFVDMLFCLSRLELVHTSHTMYMCAVKHGLLLCTLLNTIRIKIVTWNWVFVDANFGYLNGFRALLLYTFHGIYLNTTKKIEQTDNPKTIEIERIDSNDTI